MRHLHAPESDHFYINFFEAEHFLDVLISKKCYMQSNMISVIPSVRNLKISGGYLAQRLVRWSLHALLYQVCILFIKPGQSCNKEWGRKSLPYSNFFGQSGKSAMSSTPNFRWNSWSVRGTETAGCLVALQSETSFHLSFALSFDLCLVFAACHLFTISESSFW